MTKSFSVLLLLFSVMLAPTTDKLGFYKAFESSSEGQMDKELANLKSNKPSDVRDAYMGALIMKKSQFQATTKEKAEMFRDGRELLEAVIKKDPTNTEFRFLRFAIQENVPKILKYSSNLDADKAVIVKNYKHLDAVLKKVIREYASQSTHLSTSELN